MVNDWLSNSPGYRTKESISHFAFFPSLYKNNVDAVLRDRGKAFPVDIDASKSVGHLEDTIKAKKAYQDRGIPKKWRFSL
ncbi:hypothetical protein PsorP6_012679 [Peronosclerospora sorghi]|uniref:Uncharacterized protein n=1 Tax=Peronosclerospora sorghi TaxID=230839 RepID=A0ACC0WG58_9STRA|nr:hypothetical protein PsorP6_012679 [Peronosclerospora sorghi]